MKISTEAQADHQVKLTVEIEPELLEDAKRRAARRLAKQVKIPGFRPGKAPLNVVQRHVGEGALLEDALDILLDEQYPKVIEESGVDPWGPGTLQEVTALDPPVLEFMVPLTPEVTLGDYRALRFEYEARQVAQPDVDEVLDNLREQQAVIEPVDRPAQEDDMVYIILNGERAEAAEGQEKILMKDRRFPVVVEKSDTDTANEYPFPGFSRQLIGLSAGDSKALTFTYPDDYDDEDLKGVSAEFKVEVEEIKARKLPELDDEFAKAVGEEYESLDQLLDEIRTSLQSRFDEEQNDKYDEQIVEAIIEGASFKYPPQMIEHEIDHHLNDLQTRLKSQGLDMETYLKSRELESIEAYREEIKPSTEDNIRRSLGIMEVSKQEGIKVSPEVVAGKVAETLERIRASFPEEDARKIITDDYRQYLASRITTDDTLRLTLERLRAIAKGEAIPVVPQAAGTEPEEIEEQAEPAAEAGAGTE